MHFRARNAKWLPPKTGKGQSCRHDVGCRKRKASFFALVLSLFAVAVSARAQQQEISYVYDGKSLRVADNYSSYAKPTKWQVWLYENGVRIPRFAAGLQYSRWGLIEGRSVESVMQQLEVAQRFEEAYANFFAPVSRGRYTFLNPLGPIAVTEGAIENEETALETRYQFDELDELRYRLNNLMSKAQPSLENNESEGPASAHREYFDGIRRAAEQIGRLESQLARAHRTASFMQREIVSTRRAVTQAENDLRKMRASLPSMKLPTSASWMSHMEEAGSDGTIQVEIREAGPAISVRQSWTGGDGSMAGTVIKTLIPFDNIGNVDLRPPRGRGDDTWAVRVQPAHAPFPQTVTSPVRVTPRRVFPAVNLTTTESLLHLAFANPAEAGDAYAYLLYHEQTNHTQ